MVLMIAAVGSIMSTIIALVIVAILVKFFGSSDNVQDEILQEIHLLRENLQVVHNFIILDSTRYAILGGRSGFINSDGDPVPSKPWEELELEKYKGTPVLILAIKKGQGSFLDALPNMKF